MEELWSSPGQADTLIRLLSKQVNCQSRSNKDTGNLKKNNHEEAGTLMICLAVSATALNSPDIQLMLFTPDIDVLILTIVKYNLPPIHTPVAMTHKVLHIKTFWNHLRFAKSKALHAFHAFCGARNTGRFARISKATWFKTFLISEYSQPRRNTYSNA